MLRRTIVLVIALLAIGAQVRAAWNRVYLFSEPASCGFFFNANTGLVGFGRLQGVQTPLLIRRTTDGGMSWITALTPNGTGRISSIFMQTPMIGYASVMNDPNHSLLKTFDGGNTWQDATNNNYVEATCVYATSHALTETMWFSVGGSSTNGGATFNQQFSGQAEIRSNGIDFLDDLRGVVTLGPDALGGKWASFTYNTTDGGVTWNRSGLMHESWGVYANRSTGSYLAMSEDNQTQPGRTLYISNDNGATWNAQYNFTGYSAHFGLMDFTGHIAGAANMIYVQTDISNSRGLFRSSDNGASWTSVGGPSNSRDSRFCVMGCAGEIVYAFDTQGGIWKTTDGGDGTLISASSAPPLSIMSDTIRITTGDCKPASAIIPLENLNCSSFHFDSIVVEDPSGECTLVHTPNGDSLGFSSHDSIGLTYSTDTAEQRVIKIRMEGSGNGVHIDTTVTVILKNMLSVPTVSIPFDTLVHIGEFCSATTFDFPIRVSNCAPFMIDSVVLLDTSGTFTLIHRPANNTISLNSDDSVTVSYSNTASDDRWVEVRVVGTAAGKKIDTLLRMHVQNVISGSLVTFSTDTLNVFGKYCQTASSSFGLNVSNCAPFVIDTIIVQDTSGGVSLLHAPNGHLLSVGSSDSITLGYSGDSNMIRTVAVEVKGTAGSKVIDTVLHLVVDSRFTGTNGPILSLANDTIAVQTHFCQPISLAFGIANNNCDPMTIDSVRLEDMSGEFAVTHSPAAVISPFGSDSIGITFQTSVNEERTVRVHLVATIAGRIVDTMLTIQAFHSRSPEIVIDPPNSVRPGDTTVIALRMLPPTDTIAISHLYFHLSYNGDILTIGDPAFYSLGTLCADYKSIDLTPTDLGDLDCRIDLNDTITNASDFSKPLIELHFKVTLTKTMSCPILLDSFSIVGTAPLPLCTVPSVTFSVLPECGDSTLTKFMLSGNPPSILGIRPNPANDELHVVYDLNGLSTGQIEFFGELGTKMKTVGITNENSVVPVTTNDLPSGRYYVRMVTGSGVTTSGPLIIEH